MVTGKGKVASQIFKEQNFRHENECNIETKQSTINKSGSEMFLFKNIKNLRLLNSITNLKMYYSFRRI